MSTNSPVSPWTSWLPLLFVIFVSLCKQGYEDFKRYRSDRTVNSQLVSVIRSTAVQEIRCKEIRVGDFVKVNRDDEVPCDLVILYSSEIAGKCYVTTSNLDGETNLKALQVPKAFADLAEVSDVASLKGRICCQAPKPGLYKFEGRVEVSIDRGRGQPVERTGPLTIDNLALRGATLKDTDYIVGCAVYTGRDTKLSLNSKLTTHKTSLADKSINKFLLVFIVVLLAEVIYCTAMKFHVDLQFNWDYLGPNSYTMSEKLINLIFSFIILLYYILPISLYVTLEMQKFLGSYTFNWDLKMYDKSTDQPALANTSDLNEDLGQIEYLFSDKTGTLTENLMIFRRCFVDGYSYMEKDCDGKLYLLPPDGRDSAAEQMNNWTREVWQFMLSIAVCHDVHIAPPNQKARVKSMRTEFQESIRRKKRHVRVNSSLMMDLDLPAYEAASVDEKSLVEAAARLGAIFQGNIDDNEIEVNLKGTIIRFEKLEVLEFNSNRKRMSIVVRDTAGDIRLYCKGADSSVFPLMVEGKINEANMSVTDFSMRGLRTLVYGYKKLRTDEFLELRDEINVARQSMGSDRMKLVERAYAKFESGLTLLGVTALEDRLQEQVPETMEKLRAAGIKIWVLTGDKAETAENIAFSCGHFKKGTVVMRIMNVQSAQLCFIALTSLERKIKIEPYIQRGLLIDGLSLAIAMKTCPGLLRNVAMASEAVLCCRMSPLQKSEIVQLVKRSASRPMTAAIGDGGNDVSMIKEAHVGFGIIGKEGRQAAMNADYAFAKFMHLQRALLVHGHWYYLRVAVLTLYFFYKNVVFITPQLFFNFHNAYSGQALYDSANLMLFNTCFSAVPIVIYGICEQNYSDEKLMKFPQLYQLYKNNYLLSSNPFLLCTFLALWQAIAIYYIPYYYYLINPVTLYDSTPIDLWCFSTCIMYLVTLIINLELLILSSYWTFPYLLSILLTELSFLVFTFFYSLLYVSFDGNMLNVFPRLLLSPTFHLLALLVVIVCLIPALLIVFYKNARPNRLRGILESREDNISSVIYSPMQPCDSPNLPNRRSSTTFPWRGNMTFYENEAY